MQNGIDQSLCLEGTNKEQVLLVQTAAHKWVKLHVL